MMNGMLGSEQTAFGAPSSGWARSRPDDRQLRLRRHALTLAAPSRGEGDERGLRVQVLGTAELVCVLRPGHKLAARRVLKPRDLGYETLILNVRNDPILQMIEAAFRPAGVRRHARIGTNNTSTACALVRVGADIAMVEPFGVGLLVPPS